MRNSENNASELTDEQFLQLLRDREQNSGLAREQEQRKAEFQNQIDLREIFFAVKKHILIVLLVTLLGGSISYLNSRATRIPTYRSTTRMFILSQESTLSMMANIQLGYQLAPEYAVLVTSRQVMQDVIDELGLSISPNGLKGKISVTSPDNTRFMDITVTDTDPVRAKQIVDTVAVKSADYIADIMEVDPPKILEKGEIPMGSYGRSSRTDAMNGALICFMAAVGLIALSVIMDDTVKTEDDVENYFGMSVLAVVPMNAEEAASERKQAGIGRYFPAPVRRLVRRIRRLGKTKVKVR